MQLNIIVYSDAKTIDALGADHQSCTKAHSELPIFQHQPLDHMKQEIRLCRILPKIGDEIGAEFLRCTISHHALDAPANALFMGIEPRYKALSYCWGSERDSQDIIVNGQRLFVRRNLVSFLEAIRDSGEDNDTSFWVDELCIDQRNTDERNHQVSLMSSIYSQAAVVYTWLGTETCSTPLAFAMLEELEETIALPEAEVNNEQVMRRLLHDWMLTKAPMDISAFCELLSNDYWRRVWIMQEVFLANELILWCGSRRQRISGTSGWSFGFCEGESGVYDSNSIRMLLTSKSLLNPQLLGRWSIAHDAATLLSSRCERKKAASRQEFRWMRVDHAITNASPRQCSDPRDYVLGVQACLDPEMRIDIDYDKTTEATMLEFMKGPYSLLHDEFMALALNMNFQIIFHEQKAQALVALRKRYAGNAFLEAVRRHGLSLDYDPQYEVCKNIKREGCRDGASMSHLQGNNAPMTVDEEYGVDTTKSAQRGHFAHGWGAFHIKGFSL